MYEHWTTVLKMSLMERFFSHAGQLFWISVLFPWHYSLMCLSVFLISGVARLWSQGGARSPGTEPDRDLGTKPPEARYIYRQFAAVKCFSTQVCCPPSPSSVFPYLSKNSLDLCESNDPTWPGQGGLVARGYATLSYVRVCLSTYNVYVLLRHNK